MASEREIFGVSGPVYLTGINWRDPCHRRCIAASLVKGAYILERDRQQNRQGPQALAPPWWEFFGFQLNQVLVDDADRSYFGAIYEYRHTNYYYINNNYNWPGHNPPRYVIAFRGTITKPGSRSQDFKLDLQFIRNCLHRCSRFHHGLEIAKNIVLKEAGNGNSNNVWLAGHSLGSAIALLVGRDMVKMGFHLETYLFNPPFASPPIEHIKNETLRNGVRIATSFLTAGIAVAVGNHISRNGYYQESDPFIVLSKWVPYLFVNPSDPICCEYIGHFEHRNKMVRIGGGKIGKLAAQNSVLSLISGGKDSQPIHLIPSGYLTINLSPCQDFKQAHGIDQWWRTDIYCDFKLHQFK